MVDNKGLQNEKGQRKPTHRIRHKAAMASAHLPVLFFRFSRSAFSSSMAWDFLSSFSSRLERRSLLWDVTWQGKRIKDFLPTADDSLLLLLQKVNAFLSPARIYSGCILPACVKERAPSCGHRQRKQSAPALLKNA